MIGLINYGSGNIYAIANIYKSLDIPFIMSSDPAELGKVDKLILPGVGAFDETMSCLTEIGLKDSVDELVSVKRVPIMGVCVGMQIMGESSEEGLEKGFGWVPGRIRKLNSELLVSKPHLPHLGWNSISIKRDHPLMKGIDPEIGFYFLHTYYFDCDSDEDVLTTTHYGGDFPSVIQRENIYGIQFHPEKSHSNGIQLFKNFAQL